MQSSDEHDLMTSTESRMKLEVTSNKTSVSFAIVTSSSLAVEHFEWNDYPYFPVFPFNILPVEGRSPLHFYLELCIYLMRD